MGFLCINNENNKNVSIEALKKQEFLRLNGLDNVHNLNPEINFCSEIFLSPQFYVSGASKLYTGMTSTVTGCTTGMTSIYNLDYTSDITIDFVITGNTDYTGYTGNFCCRIFPDTRFGITPTGILTAGSEIVNDCVPFNMITGGTISLDFMEGYLPKTWAQYLIRPYYSFESKTCNPGLYFNSWDQNEQLNSFDNNTDYYFMTVTNPPTPNLNPPNGQGMGNYALVTDKLYVNGTSGPRGPQSINGSLNYFMLSSIPSNGQVLLILNGVQLTQDYDFTLISQGYGIPPLIKISNDITSTDWLLATYINGATPNTTTNFGTYFIDTILVSSFTNLSTNSYRVVGDNTLNYNPITLNYEFFTTLPLDPTYSLVVSVNGVKLAENEQFFKSTSFDGKIIFNKTSTTFNIGDVISVLAVSKSFNNNDYGSLSKNEFLVQWSVPPTFTNSDVTGRFIIQAFNDNTSVLTNQTFVDFVPGQANYQSLLTNLSLNINYRFRVTFEATYYGYLNNVVITCSYSEGYFDTTNSYINNTY